MPEPFTLYNLLSRNDDPSTFLSKEITNAIIRWPEQISILVAEDDDIEEIRVYLSTRSDRLVPIFNALHKFQINQARLPAEQLIVDRIARATVKFLCRTLEFLNHDLEPSKLVAFLRHVISVCLTVDTSSALRDVAKQLVRIPKVFNQLACEDKRPNVIQLWINSPVFIIQDKGTVAAWTDALVQMVSVCPDLHNISGLLQDWEMLCQLKDALRKVEKEYNEGTPQIFRDTRTRIAGANQAIIQQAPSSNLFPDLGAILEVACGLEKFQIPMPKSERSLANVLETLEHEKTYTIIREIVATFPCSVCMRSLLTSRPPAESHQGDLTRRHKIKSQELMQFLGNRIGEWKVTLSVSAFKNVQTQFQRNGNIPQRLVDISSGKWDFVPAGSKQQRHALRVPLATTKCGQDLLILWQVDIETDVDSQILRQIVRVWAVGKAAVIDKTINRVIMIQKTFTDKHVQRCRQKPIRSDGKLIPLCFDDRSSADKAESEHSTKLDVTDVDPETVDMANKFYALTKPMVRAIITNNLAAEFPFDLSTDEFRVINHFETASLILGRSGTGKTTCLIFKMVSKYLARMSMSGVKPIRQVLLTRSSFLADKLRDYSSRLIQGQTSQTLHFQALKDGAAEDWSQANDTQIEQDALMLEDKMFPLVTTFIQFLQILENTVRVLDRNNFDENHVLAEDSLVTVRGFELEYWPRLPTSLTKHLSAHLVFPEILGVIKGSVSSTRSLLPLNLDEYVNVSSRIAPSFASVAERALVYKIYQYYESIKKYRAEFDLVDRVVRLLAAIRESPNLQHTLAAEFDEVYIDEVQDHQCIDFALFLSFIKDARGIHCAGDTAQAISQDSAFRFNDPKGLFYEHFAAASQATRQHDLSRPKLFTLNKNYRSHQGILSVASLIMDLLWKGFPETIDKLDPEIGKLSGPKPVLFLSCSARNFIPGTEDDIKLSKQAVEFGAEQVILVRDEATKEELQKEFGDAALILTVLQSKGMEFDDVVLWNFFGGSAPASAARKLQSLYMETTKFDSKKYWSLCSELKHLYVAVTRARMQLFFVEDSTEDSAFLVELFTKDVPEALVEVTRPGHAIFQEKLMSLLHGDSADPLKWAVKGQQLMQSVNYEDAAKCFRKAGDRRAETIALGRMHEEDARRCNASGNAAAFREHLEAALNHFLHAEMRVDASRCLVRMQAFSHAAKLWLKAPPRDLSRAASLFLQANSLRRAVVCFRIQGRHRDAADALMKGNLYDILVPYLSQNIDHFSAKDRGNYARLCKLLLKRNEIKNEIRKNGITLLGTPDEQESTFVQYGMVEDLMDLYAEQRRYKELFDLLLERQVIEEALAIALIGNKEAEISMVQEDIVTQLLQYVCAEQFYACKNGSSRRLNLPDRVKSRLPVTLLKTVEDWTTCCSNHFNKPTNVKKVFATLENASVKATISFQLLIDHSFVTELVHFDEIPLDMVHSLIDLIRNIELKDDISSWKLLLLAAGVWTLNDHSNPSVMPWSPLVGLHVGIGEKQVKGEVKRFALSKLSSMLLLLDSKARELFMSMCPTRCSQFLVKGFCPRKRRGDKCDTMHERIVPADCSTLMEDTLRINRLFCSVTTLFYRQVFQANFQENFLRIKRHWLERLLRELTWGTAFEQDASVISQTKSRIFQKKEFPTVSSALEDLLYHRLRKDWSTQITYTTFLEQVQIARLFGRDIEIRFSRSLFFNLETLQNSERKRWHLKKLDSLDWEAETFSAAELKTIMIDFLNVLPLLNPQDFEAMHTVTSIFEQLALYLFLKTCPTAFVVPQAWLDLYLPRLPLSALMSSPVTWSKKYVYREMLEQLVLSFCALIGRLDPAYIGPGYNFACGSRKIQKSFMQQRNVDFLVIAIVNLHANANVPTDHNKAYMTVQRVLNLSSVRSFHLNVKTVDELRNNLAPSFNSYEGKNPLVVTLKDLKQKSFEALLSQKGVFKMTFDDLRGRMRSSKITKAPLKTEGPKDEDIKAEQRSQAEIAGVCLLQRRWRKLRLKILRRRAWLQSPEAQLIARFIKLGEKHPVTSPIPNPMRVTLIENENGITSHLLLSKAHESFSELHKDAMAKLIGIEKVDQLDEVFDSALQELQVLERTHKQAEVRMGDQSLRKIVDDGDTAGVTKVFLETKDLATHVLMRVTEIRKILLLEEEKFSPVVEPRDGANRSEASQGTESKEDGRVSPVAEATNSMNRLKI